MRKATLSDINRHIHGLLNRDYYAEWESIGLNPGKHGQHRDRWIASELQRKHDDSVRTRNACIDILQTKIADIHEKLTNICEKDTPISICKRDIPTIKVDYLYYKPLDRAKSDDERDRLYAEGKAILNARGVIVSNYNENDLRYEDCIISANFMDGIGLQRRGNGFFEYYSKRKRT